MSPLNTSVDVIANVSRVVTRVIDRITGDRVEVPLMVAAATIEALKCHGIQGRIVYGQAAWIEILESNEPVWAGCWGKFHSFWAATQFGEIVDLNTAVAYRKRVPGQLASQFSPPLVWTHELPRFYRYQPEGEAALELTEERDLRQYELVLNEVREKCGPHALAGGEQEFPNEAILCPGRKLLDDSNQTFLKFDRVLAVKGIPDAPF